MDSGEFNFAEGFVSGACAAVYGFDGERVMFYERNGDGFVVSLTVVPGRGSSHDDDIACTVAAIEGSCSHMCRVLKVAWGIDLSAGEPFVTDSMGNICKDDDKMLFARIKLTAEVDE